MKNLYLLLLFVFAFGNAQTAVSNYTQCDDDTNDGFALFNLNLQNSMIMANFNVAEHTLQYYQSLADAESLTNPIPLSEFYTNTSNPQQLFARVTNIQTQESFYFSFNLIVNPRPIAHPAILNFCSDDPNQTAVFNLDDAIPQIVGNQQNMMVVFYDSPTGGNVIVGGNFTPTVFPVQVLGAQIDNGTCGSERTTIILNTNNNCNFVCPEPNAPIITLQADNETVNISWNLISNVSRYQLYFTAATEPAPTAASTPTTTTESPFHSITGLTPFTCYSLYIRTVCDQSGSNNFSEWVGPAQVCTNPCIAPTAIIIPSATITSQTAIVTWVSSAQTLSHEVYYTPNGGPNPNSGSPNGIFVPLSGSFNSYVITNLVPGVCYDVYLKANCSAEMESPWVGPRTFCTYSCVNAGNCPDNLTLIAFLDQNENGTREVDEPTFTKGSFAYELNGSGILEYGSSNYGIFIMTDSNPQNLYDLSYTIDQDFAPYYGSTATYNDINIPTGGGTNMYYFPIRQLQNFNNLVVNLIPLGSPRPGFTYINEIKYKNDGTGTIALGTITFTKDNLVTISSISQSGITNTASGFTFDFTNLLPGEERHMMITMLVPTIPTVALGQTLTHSVAITPIVDDAFPENNSDTLTQIIVGSYDPNDKTESHGGKIALDAFTTDDYLTYTIQFENTGTASAEFIRVEDLLDAGLNPDTVEMLSASHSYNMRKTNNKLIWNFYDVNLPPTSSNPAQSHGYVQFKVKPTTGYAVGTMIPNAADIFFDYNPAIVTDTFETQFVATLAAASFDANGFYMYPNPANTFLYLGLIDIVETIATIDIYDVLGKSVKAINNLKSNQIGIDVSRFSKGIYFLEITTRSHRKVNKKLMID